MPKRLTTIKKTGKLFKYSKHRQQNHCEVLKMANKTWRSRRFNFQPVSKPKNYQNDKITFF